MNELFDVTADVSPNIPVEEIENDHMCVIGIVQDCSGSMDCYTSDMVQSLNNFVKSIQDSKQDDEILVSVTTFDYTVKSSGFQNVADLDTNYQAYGATAMNDGIIVAGQQLMDYVKQLNDSGVRARGILVVFSDGEDNHSSHSSADVAKVIQELKRKEMITAFVAFGHEAHGIADGLGIDKGNILETDASPSDLRKIWGILSKSAISSSKSVAAGASQTSFFEV